jgi:hypothetical protein
VFASNGIGNSALSPISSVVQPCELCFFATTALARLPHFLSDVLLQSLLRWRRATCVCRPATAPPRSSSPCRYLCSPRVTGLNSHRNSDSHSGLGRRHARALLHCSRGSG